MSFISNRRQLNHLPHLTNPNTSPLSHLHYTQLENTNFHIHGQTLFYLFILFAIVLLATLLLLYARWFFRFRHLRTAAVSIQRAPQAAPAKGLDAAVIKAMPITLHVETAVERKDNESECCICLGVFDEGDKVKVLTQCKHTFHSHCVDLWLSSQPTCPLCRLSLLPPPTPTPTPTPTQV